MKYELGLLLFPLKPGSPKIRLEINIISTLLVLLLLFTGSLPGRNWEREELERLQSAYFTSQRNRISCELSNVKTKKILAQAEKQVKMLKTMKNFDVTTEQVAEQVEKNVKEVEAHQSSINTALTNVGDRLVKLQQLNSTQVSEKKYHLVINIIWWRK